MCASAHMTVVIQKILHIQPNTARGLEPTDEAVRVGSLLWRRHPPHSTVIELLQAGMHAQADPKISHNMRVMLRAVGEHREGLPV